MTFLEIITQELLVSGCEFVHVNIDMDIHAVEFVIKGGFNDKISEILYLYKPMGVLTVGNTTHFHTTNHGIYTIRFSRVEKMWQDPPRIPTFSQKIKMYFRRLKP